MPVLPEDPELYNLFQYTTAGCRRLYFSYYTGVSLDGDSQQVKRGETICVCVCVCEISVSM